MSDVNGNHTCKYAVENKGCLVTMNTEKCSGVRENCELEYCDECGEAVKGNLEKITIGGLTHYLCGQCRKEW